MSEKKKKILWISDHPLVPSGVGTQSRYVIEGLLATGKYEFFCLGGAVKHPKYDLQVVNKEKNGDSWKILPVDGYGDKNVVRRVLREERPDAMVIFTDPRFFVWLWEMEDEVRTFCPLLYWHVWDNDPTPVFNKAFYDSNDHIITLSLKTYGLLQGMDYPRDRFSYVPHAIPPEIFRPLPEEEVLAFKKKNFGPHGERDFVLFWNNRNARRKMTGDVIASFAKFLKKVGRERAALMMHTDPRDPEGQDIVAVAKCYDMEKNMIVSERRCPPEELNMFYNVCDCTINIANNEGFGLGTLESLMAGTPIVAQMTGGLQFQVGDWWEGLKDFSDQEKMYNVARSRGHAGKWWGSPVFPASRSCTGSQPMPFIYDDRVSHDDVVKALCNVYEMGRGKRKELGLKAREWASRCFNLKDMVSSWDRIFEEQIPKWKGGSRIHLATI